MFNDAHDNPHTLQASVFDVKEAFLHLTTAPKIRKWKESLLFFPFGCFGWRECVVRLWQLWSVGQTSALSLSFSHSHSFPFCLFHFSYDGSDISSHYATHRKHTGLIKVSFFTTCDHYWVLNTCTVHLQYSKWIAVHTKNVYTATQKYLVCKK